MLTYADVCCISAPLAAVYLASAYCRSGVCYIPTAVYLAYADVCLNACYYCRSGVCYIPTGVYLALDILDVL